MRTNATRLAARTGRVDEKHGFTMVEMLIVVALIGIVAAIAMPNFRNTTLRAREAVLREDLWVLRDVIDQYHTDKGKWPATLEDLGPNGAGYLRAIPVDPFTKSSDTWEPTMDEPAPDAPEDEETEPGITDVHSGAPGVGLDGTAYSTW